jgi:hypothetical protein
VLSKKTAFRELTQPNRADAGKISKGKGENRKNKNTKKSRRAGGGKLYI